MCQPFWSWEYRPLSPRDYHVTYSFPVRATTNCVKFRQRALQGARLPSPVPFLFSHRFSEGRKVLHQGNMADKWCIQPGGGREAGELVWMHRDVGPKA
jgi:hypothetical protein